MMVNTTAYLHCLIIHTHHTVINLFPIITLCCKLDPQMFKPIRTSFAASRVHKYTVQYNTGAGHLDGISHSMTSQVTSHKDYDEDCPIQYLQWAGNAIHPLVPPSCASAGWHRAGKRRAAVCTIMTPWCTIAIWCIPCLSQTVIGIR